MSSLFERLTFAVLAVALIHWRHHLVVLFGGFLDEILAAGESVFR
jgi:hypothetical protein